jgi:hypothetical protein
MKTTESLSTPLSCAQWLTLRWTRGTRHYRAHLEQDLWRDWVVTQVNGRRGSALGRTRTHPQPSLAAALNNLVAIVECREKRGYEPYQ